METNSSTSKIHPLTATAAVALILLSLTGIAAMTGILPSFNKPATPETSATPNPETIGASAPASAPLTASASASAPATAANTPTSNKTSLPANKGKTNQNYNAPNYNQVSEANNAPAPIAPVAPPCYNCGVVESVSVHQQKAPTSGLGAAAGAILGGVLGHQVGGGNGKTLATVAGAVGGGLAGNAVEQNTHTATSYAVVVRMEDGSKQRFIMKEQRWKNGDLVRVDNGQLSARDQ
jgi:outer membrane lipoprotein SlyB